MENERSNIPALKLFDLQNIKRKEHEISANPIKLDFATLTPMASDMSFYPADNLSHTFQEENAIAVTQEGTEKAKVKDIYHRRTMRHLSLIVEVPEERNLQIHIRISQDKGSIDIYQTTQKIPTETDYVISSWRTEAGPELVHIFLEDAKAVFDKFEITQIKSI